MFRVSRISRQTRLRVVVCVVKALVVLQLSGGYGAGPAEAQTKIKRHDITGAWQYNLTGVDTLHEIKMVETLTFDTHGTGMWEMVPTNKSHKTWSHKFTWFVASDRVIAVSLAQSVTLGKAALSKDTMYAQFSRDKKALLVTVEPGRVERYDRLKRH